MEDTPMTEEPLDPPQLTPTAANQHVMHYIETTFNTILNEITLPSSNGKPVITLKRIVSVKPYYDDDDFAQLKWHIESREVNYHFPGKNQDEAWRFACVGRILGEIYAAIKHGVTITKRDIYYHDPDIFKSQVIVDRYVDDVAHTCQVTRRDLNVVASPKGLVAGLSNAPANDETPVIQTICDSTPIIKIAHINWMLVVEKEATFNALVEREFHQDPIIGPGLLVTAKGYPDLATKHFLRRILDQAPGAIQVFGLFDWDPDGIRILKCYLYGSMNLAQESDCNIPEMRWIGLKGADVAGCQQVEGASMALTPRDRTAAISMLASPEWQDDSGDILPGLCGAVTELRQMLVLNRKADIQSLDETQSGLEVWLTEKLMVQLD
ncbi:endodeoxyribonuclease [Cladophialophora chaetospira]|uniref:DNA topoisomerase (ATP-hydrolyzing) n=1 Tax=Cladophialophora chaetospira TaxID=386627 RepID=A0AA38WW74_9EURO|nr:endodeoxyribonuclease [Cladophialophora chaetospira]